MATRSGCRIGKTPPLPVGEKFPQSLILFWRTSLKLKELLSGLTKKTFSSGSGGVGSPLVWGFSMGTGGGFFQQSPPRQSGEMWGRVSVEILHGDGEEA